MKKVKFSFLNLASRTFPASAQTYLSVSSSTSKISEPISSTKGITWVLQHGGLLLHTSMPPTFFSQDLFSDVDCFKSLYWICYNIFSVFCFVFFWPRGMWDLCSPNRDPTHTPCIWSWSLNLWTVGEVPHTFHAFVLSSTCRKCWFCLICYLPPFLDSALDGTSLWSLPWSLCLKWSPHSLNFHSISLVIHSVTPWILGRDAGVCTLFPFLDCEFIEAWIIFVFYHP